MILILGFISLIQVLFLPGAILIKHFNFRRSVIQTMVYVFGLSLIFNFTWVFFLSSLKINYPIIHYILFILEFVVFSWVYREKLFARTEDITSNLYHRMSETLDSLIDFFRIKNQETTFSRILKSVIIVGFFIGAISSLFWVSKLFFTNFGTVFKQWDAVVSWNRWAEEWFNNIIPVSHRYPQLIPANFSITYSFQRSTDIQIFAKSIMPIFTIFTWLAMLDLAFEYKNPGIFIGVVILRYLTKKFLGQYIGEGYVDVALLFFSFLTVYTLLIACNEKNESAKLKYVYLGIIFAAGTALTKQNGLLIFVFYPLLAILLLTDKSNYASIWERSKFLIKPLLLGLLILLPWYLVNESRIYLGIDSSNLEILISADRHSGRSYIERAFRSIDMLEIYKYLYVLVLVCLPLIPKRFRQVALITIFPYTIIWMFLFSVFARNLAMVFPFLALIAGIGIDGLINFCLYFAQKIKFNHLKVGFYIIPFVLLIFGVSKIFTDKKLTEMQITDQKDALLPKINQQLYNYFEDKGKYGVIMTQYPLEYLPYLEDYKVNEPFSIYKEFYENFNNHPKVEYFLVWDKYSSKEVENRINYFQKIGAIKFYFKEYNLSFYKVLDRNAIVNTQPD